MVALAQDAPQPVAASEQPAADLLPKKHEYSVYLAGGQTELLYTPEQNGKTVGGIGAVGGFTYTYNIDKNWALSVGLEYLHASGKVSFKRLEEEYDTYDNRSNPPGKVRWKYVVTDYEEKQKYSLLSVPVMARLRTAVNERLHFYAAGGFKFGLPIKAEARISGGSLVSSGYYDHEHVNYTDMPEYGFFNGQGSATQKSEIDLNPPVSLALEAGLRFPAGKHSFFVGAFMDYCLNNIKKTSDKHPMQYDGAVTYQSALNSSLARRSGLRNVGVKVGLSF
jgi:hypothetical protein